MENTKEKIDKLVAQDYNFRFGDYISQGFDLLQKDLGSFVGFTLIMLILTSGISAIPYFIGSIANQLVVSPALLAGLFIYAHKLNKGERPSFNDFFKGFDYVGQIVPAAALTLLITLASLIPFGIICWNTGIIEWYMELLKNPGGQPELPNFPPAWSYLLLLPSVYFSIAYSWSSFFIIFHKMDFWAAMEASRKLITKRWFTYFGFTIVLGLIAASGVILLCIGILATMPAVYCMMYAAFADVTKLNEEAPEDDHLEDHLIV